MPPTAAETRDAILRNARAAEQERLRTIARKRWPALSEEELDTKVREVDLEKLSRAGQMGRRTQQRNADIGKTWLTVQEEIEIRLQGLLAIVAKIPAAGTDETA